MGLLEMYQHLLHCLMKHRTADLSKMQRNIKSVRGHNEKQKAGLCLPVKLGRFVESNNKKPHDVHSYLYKGGSAEFMRESNQCVPDVMHRGVLIMIV